MNTKDNKPRATIKVDGKVIAENVKPIRFSTHIEWCKCDDIKEYNHPHCDCPIEDGSIEPLDFYEWYEIVEEEVNISLAESGADRELDFNPEKEFEKKYESYIDDPKFHSKPYEECGKSTK